MVNKMVSLPKILANIDISGIQSTTDGQVETIIKMVSHYGLYVMAAVVIVTVVKMGTNARRGGDVEITPLVIEAVAIAVLIALNAAGVSWLGI